MKELTKQQTKVLACVEVYLNQTGFPPTRAEICKELGFKSPNAAEMHLRALEKKGYINLLKKHFKKIKNKVTHQFFIPYTWFTTICSK